MQRTTVWSICLIAVASLGAWYWLRAGADGADAAASKASASAAAPAGAQGQAGTAAAMAADSNTSTGHAPFTAHADASRAQRLALAEARVQRTQQVYESYRLATRYPHESRPITEHPDQLRPFDPITEEKNLRDMNGKPIKGLRLRTTQSMVFMSGNDAVTFNIAAFDERGNPQPLLITRAVVSNLPESKTPVQLTQVALEFNDSGNAPDVTANDGVYSAQLTPAQQGFAAINGTLRLLAQVSVNGEQGVAHFDVIYAPAVPATWAGVRETMENGSLNFYLKAKVTETGRYVVSARVDDADGKPFALLQFNDEVATGEREFKLNLFGVLVRDLAPKFPLKLRDVQGFVLYPDRFPDRAMMARQRGVVHLSGSYPLDKFSQDEWTSEERERYLKEYKADLERALQERERASGG